MLVELDKKGLLALVRGSQPAYELFDDPLISEHGSYAASYGRWEWSFTLNNLSEEMLFHLYKLMKD